MATPRTDLALVASLIAGLSTAVGALPVLLVRSLPPLATSILLGFGGGVMLAASAFTLVGGGLELLEGAGRVAPVAQVAGGILLGALFLWGADRSLPHEHFLQGHHGPDARFVHGAWLFVFAIGLHNLPEGLAVGVGFSGADVATGQAITLGIVLQNLPEGLIAAAALVGIGIARGRALAIVAVTGLVEFLGGVLGLLLGLGSEALVAAAMAFAAGAMLYVVGQEVIPEAHAGGRQRAGTWGIVGGFVVMTSLDRLLR